MGIEVFVGGGTKKEGSKKIIIFMVVFFCLTNVENRSTVNVGV